MDRIVLKITKLDLISFGHSLAYKDKQNTNRFDIFSLLNAARTKFMTCLDCSDARFVEWIFWITAKNQKVRKCPRGWFRSWRRVMMYAFAITFTI